MTSTEPPARRQDGYTGQEVLMPAIKTLKRALYQAADDPADEVRLAGAQAAVELARHIETAAAELDAQTSAGKRRRADGARSLARLDAAVAERLRRLDAADARRDAAQVWHERR